MKIFFSAFFLLAASVGAQEHRPMRILLNEGGTFFCFTFLQRNCLILCLSCHCEDDSTKGCNAADIDIIQATLNTEENLHRHRDLQLGPTDCPCEDDCVGWAPGYCFWYFCPWVNRRNLQEEEASPLEDCAGDLVVVNNVLNSAIPLVSAGCQEVLLAKRTFQCH